MVKEIDVIVVKIHIFALIVPFGSLNKNDIYFKPVAAG